MKRTLKFYKDTDSKWYVDLPEWKGEKWELEMVCGADTMLELMSQGEESVTLLVFDELNGETDYVGYFTLTKIKDTPDVGGALYKFTNDFSNLYPEMEVWLCHVTSFVFGELPQTIYLI